MMPTLIPAFCGAVDVVDMTRACIGNSTPDVTKQMIEKGAQRKRSFKLVEKKAGSFFSKVNICMIERKGMMELYVNLPKILI